MTDVLCLILRPYDTTFTVTLEGPPFPFGVSPYETDQEFTYNGAEVAIFFSDIGFRSQTADEPPNTYFPPLLESAFNYEVRLWQGDEPSGQSRPGFGDIVIINTDGSFDQHMAKGWSGRSLTLFRVDQDSAWSTKTAVFRGIVDSLVWDEEVVRVRLRDRQAIFNKPFQTVFYSGDGGTEGGEDVKGKPKPIALGNADNVSSLLIVTSNLVYQATSALKGGVLVLQEITAIRDKGVALTAAGRVSDVFDAAPASGEWSYDNRGLIRVGALPDGLLTADVTVIVGGRPTFAEIVLDIVTTLLGPDSLAALGEIDTAAFTALDADPPTDNIVLNFWLGADETPTVADVLDRLFEAVGGFWYMTPLGKFSCGILIAPAAPADHTLTEVDIGLAPRLERVRTAIPSYRRRVGYKPHWKVQSADDLAGSVSAADVALYGEGLRFAQAEDLSIRTKHPLARDVTGGGLFDTSADADAEDDRLLTLHGAERGVYRLPVERDPFAIKVAETVAISGISRFGFSDPEHFLVIGVAANAATGELILELWG